jgi:hypothetical protein
MKLEHQEKVITDIKNRRIILGCTCGWQTQLRLLPGPDSTYSDANAWASHFDFEPRISPYL